jgi:hypothetical protein
MQSNLLVFIAISVGASDVTKNPRSAENRLRHPVAPGLLREGFAMTASRAISSRRGRPAGSVRNYKKINHLSALAVSSALSRMFLVLLRPRGEARRATINAIRDNLFDQHDNTGGY